MPKNIQPRVLSYDEARKLRRNKKVFLEYTGYYNMIHPVIVYEKQQHVIVFRNHLPCPWESYGAIPAAWTDWGWRLWTDEPTEEQRKAASWKGA